LYISRKAGDNHYEINLYISRKAGDNHYEINLYISRKAVEELDTSIIDHIFICCQMNMWTIEIKIMPTSNIIDFKS
jgi:hypothetical protein